MQLYRHALKTCLDWSGERAQWYPRARAIRAEFEANRDISSREQARALVEHGEKLLEDWKSPEPLLPPYYPGGTMYSRNPPMPKEAKIMLDFGREEHGH
jgi:NADH dehydrogenase (ubiquinone) 1 beta subcomplex subunit 9